MIRIVPFTENHVNAAKAFNSRMRARNAPTDFLLPETVSCQRNNPSQAVYSTQFLAVEDEDVRGGFIELVHPGWVNGSEQTAANYQSPLSEGIADKKYGMVALQMIRYMQEQRPYLFVVGMGDSGNPLPRVLRASGWDVFAVPFLFRVENAGRVLRELVPLRRTAAKRLAASVAAFTGAGWVGSRALRVRSIATMVDSRRYTIEPIDKWGVWTDPLWQQFRSNCSFTVVRDSSTLDAIYPLGSGRVLAWVVKRQGQPIGWAAGLNTQMQNGKYFGNLRVGTILDCVASPEAAAAVVWLTASMLARAGADVVVTNQQHRMWRKAFGEAGFMEWPSNYLLGISKRLTAECDRNGGRDAIHITRGDGDGRIHL